MKRLQLLAASLRYPEDFATLGVITFFSLLAAIAKFLHGKEPIGWRITLSTCLMGLVTSYMVYSVLHFYMDDLAAWPTIGISVVSSLFWPDIMEKSRIWVNKLDFETIKKDKKND